MSDVEEIYNVKWLQYTGKRADGKPKRLLVFTDSIGRIFCDNLLDGCWAYMYPGMTVARFSNLIAPHERLPLPDEIDGK